ncbi:conjugal transfer protein TrbL family protein [Acetobacterium bakii]|uniref:Conjugal transfer protein TrbL n=1 Tax=Acetobacterium bakii TaxID=52689 RepID=A0A0L6U1M8_9FIRM|nr:conjugal transfer protein TrbL family protein [Acetobacterium bakii]KNZ42408.1 hypothetical protein AKG39_06455 [Acetobacterium bakii]
MYSIFKNFIFDAVNNSGIVTGSIKTLAEHVFYIEQWIGDASGLDFTASLTHIFYQLALLLLAIKFTKNGFETYITWTGGDPDSDPWAMLQRTVKAVVLIVAFPVLYDIFARVCTGVLYEILNSMNTKFLFDDNFSKTLTEANIGPFALGIFYIGVLVLYFQMVGRGIQMWMMQIGFPLACVGLIESDNGVFAPFMMTFFKAGVTTVVQLSLLSLSYILMATGDFIIGFGTLTAGIATPALLQQFMVHSGNANLSGKALTIARVTEVAVRAVK